MRGSILRAYMAPLCVLLSTGQAHAMSWQHVKAMPFVVKDGLEIARQAQGKAPASLHIVCSENKELHLVLSTRLPGPRWAIEKGRDEEVSLFVGGIERQLKVVMDMVAKGQDLTWLESAVSRDGRGEPDTLVTTPLKAAEITKLSSWFGDMPPLKVSIVGYAETGVVMVGAVSGPAIAEVNAWCVAE
ncbi:hypothetical protein [Neorhizobium sp. T25_27]|uniref:hypothetical protein n=1 Tax=Neorhizobium sp. T25_27 TaxID=2093831 RepID=UPI000CF893C9|nr:hypothetical protein [Neorhizobium sp. T25_27]